MFLIPHILRCFCTTVRFCEQHQFFKAQTWGFIFCKKTGHFWLFSGIFSEPSHFSPLMEPFLTKKWSRIQNYIHFSFKWSKNEVKRTFLAPSKNYHASTSAKINLVPEVRPICIYIEFERCRETIALCACLSLSLAFCQL